MQGGKLKLFFKWGIKFGEEHTVSDKGNRKVEYAGKDNLQDEIFKKYHAEKSDTDIADDEPIPGAPDSEDNPGDGQKQCQSNESSKSKGGAVIRTGGGNG